MPGDPKQCREHAKRCLQLAQEATNPALKDSLSDIAQQWMHLATDLEATKRLLDAWGEPSLWQPGWPFNICCGSYSRGPWVAAAIQPYSQLYSWQCRLRVP